MHKKRPIRDASTQCVKAPCNISMAPQVSLYTDIKRLLALVDGQRQEVSDFHFWIGAVMLGIGSNRTMISVR